MYMSGYNPQPHVLTTREMPELRDDEYDYYIAATGGTHTDDSMMGFHYQRELKRMAADGHTCMIDDPMSRAVGFSPPCRPCLSQDRADDEMDAAFLRSSGQ